MQWISQMKSRVLDVFRGIDRDQDGRISQREFIESVLSSSECAQDPWWAGAGSWGRAPPGRGSLGAAGAGADSRAPPLEEDPGSVPALAGLGAGLSRGQRG